jgi:hypothetical protein
VSLESTDLEQQPVGGFEAHMRGEVARPAGQGGQGLGFALGLALMGAQTGHQGQRVGQTHARFDAGFGGQQVGDHDALPGDGRCRCRQGEHLDG